MKYALFYFSAYNRSSNFYERFIVSTPDGQHDRYAVALDELRSYYTELSNWSGQFICLTNDDVFKAL